MSHLQVFYGHFTTRTIVDHRTWISEKPLKNHRCQWSICKKTFNGDGQGVAKPLKNHRWQWCPGKKHYHRIVWKKMTIVEVYSKDREVHVYRFYIPSLRTLLCMTGHIIGIINHKKVSSYIQYTAFIVCIMVVLIFSDAKGIKELKDSLHYLSAFQYRI